MTERYTKATKNILLAFVLITIGFALGKEAAKRGAAETASVTTVNAATNSVANPEAQSRVMVYYAHASFRCVTCNTIEALAKKAVETRFNDESSKGQVEWHVVNFQEDEAFAKRYDIVSSCIVVIAMQGDAETGHTRLDEVWTKMSDPPAFEEYIVDAVREFLPAHEGGTE